MRNDQAVEPTVLYVHGGVSGRPKESAADLARAVASGQDHAGVLAAVEAAVRVMEDEPTLNAGYGSVLNIEGGIELDAGIADGATRSWAGVANVDLAHPVSFARAVMERTPHVLVTGSGAQALAEAWGFDELGRSTPDRHEQWDEASRKGELTQEGFARAEHVDTVGAVGVDAQGRLAAASSTGGVFGKLRGRVGDSPIFGAGIYADESVAVVGTGVGELFLQTMACARVGWAVGRGAAVQSACEEIVSLIQDVARDQGPALAAGLLAVDASGSVGAAFAGGSWHVAGPEGPVDAVRLT